MRLFIASLLFASALMMRPQNTLAAELIMFEEDGCPWCERWHKDIGVVYHKTKEGQLLPLRVVDTDNPHPEDLAAIKGIYYTPTFVIWDQGRELGRIRGYPGEEFFFPMINEFIQKHGLNSNPKNNPAHIVNAPMGACQSTLC